MFFSNNYIQFSKDLDIYNSQYNVNIMVYFIKKYSLNYLDLAC